MVVPIVPAAVRQPTELDVTHAPLPSILTRLRLETRDEHKELERVLDLMDIALTRDVYCRRLVQYYGFYRPLEAALQIRCALPNAGPSGTLSPLATFIPRLNKTRLLSQDLHQLQVPTEGLPLCRDLPQIETQAEVMGCLYVLEGATLGGRMIGQHVHATLGITSTTGGSFFEGYAGDTGRMWNAMRNLLLTCAVDAETEDAIVMNARATFADLRNWCEPAIVDGHEQA